MNSDFVSVIRKFRFRPMGAQNLNSQGTNDPSGTSRVFFSGNPENPNLVGTWNIWKFCEFPLLLERIEIQIALYSGEFGGHFNPTQRKKSLWERAEVASSKRFIFRFFENFKTLFRAFWVQKRSGMHPKWILINKLASQTKKKHFLEPKMIEFCSEKSKIQTSALIPAWYRLRRSASNGCTQSAFFLGIHRIQMWWALGKISNICYFPLVSVRIWS